MSARHLQAIYHSYVFRRLLAMVPQIVGVTLVVFFLIRLFPGDPAYLFAGPTASEEMIEATRVRLGLDQSIFVQYWDYLSNLVQGDLGMSLVTSQPVLDDLLSRFPATFELITAALVLCILVGVPFAALGARKPKGLTDNAAKGYGLLAGSLPDFWWGLMLVFVFFTTLDLAPSPTGRLGIGEIPPESITGLYTVDSLLTGNFAAFKSALSQLVLPAVTLAFIYGGPIVKHMRSAMATVLQAPYLEYAEMSGLSRWTMFRYAFRSALPPAMTMTGMTYAYLIGGAVLVETVFSWGGLGQYAVEAITSSDYLAVSGTVLATTIFALIVYLILDFLYTAVDPRTRN